MLVLPPDGLGQILLGGRAANGYFARLDRALAKPSHDATFAGRAGLAANIALVAAIALVLSALSYRLIERPCLAFRKRLDANRRARAAAHPVQMAADQ